MLVIKGGTIMTPDKVIEQGSVLINEGKIAQVGKDIAVPAGAKVVEAGGKFIIPGMIDAHCHTGVFADGVGWEKSDGNEMDQNLWQNS
jgi:imidazolonepropionase-like amidohydrolase